jgi:hypothetical protein
MTWRQDLLRSSYRQPRFVPHKYQRIKIGGLPGAPLIAFVAMSGMIVSTSAILNERKHLFSPVTVAYRYNPIMSGALFLLYLCATASAPLCFVVGLSLFAVQRFRRSAPYVALVYPATYCGGFLGVVAAFQFNALVRTEGWSQEVALPVFLACLLGGAGMCGFLGYKLANQIAKHFQ